MAAKIKDGLFIGDGETSQSEDFINDNKISNLINLSGREVPNLWASHGLVYMTFHWEDKPDFRLGLNSYRKTSSSDKDKGGDFLSDIVEFIDVSIKHGISVLLFSRNGTGRCIAAACAYLMIKYHWGFEKSFEFIYTKKTDINLNRGFIQQLFAFDKHLLLLSAKPEKLQILQSQVKQEHQDPSAILNLIASSVLSKEEYQQWKEWHNPINTSKTLKLTDYDNDELILVNGYLNSKVTITSLPGPYRGIMDVPKKMKLRFNEFKYEEDVNLFPTSPPDIRYTVLPKGVLRHTGRGTAAGPPGKKGDSRDHAPDAKQGNMTAVRAKRESEAKSGGGYHGNTSYDFKSSIPSHEGGASNDDDDQDDNVSDISSIGDHVLASSPKRYTRDEEDLPQSQSVSQQQHSIDDLYGYIGVPPPSTSSTSNSNSNSRDAKTSSNNNNNNNSNNNNKHNDNSQLSAEERLKKLVAGLGGNASNPNGNPSGNPSAQSSRLPRSTGQQQQQYSSTYDDNDSEVSFDAPGPSQSKSNNNNINKATNSSSSAASIGSVSNASSSTGTGPPSLYDLANMRMANSNNANARANVGAGNAGRLTQTINSSSSTSNGRQQQQDPLQAFEQMQKSGVVRARYDIDSTGQGGQAQVPTIRSSVSMPSRKAAWAEGGDGSKGVSSSMDYSSGSNSGGSNANGSAGKVAPRFASPHIRQPGASGDQAQKTYRQGSPAPRTQQSRTSSSGQTPQQQQVRGGVSSSSSFGRSNTSNANQQPAASSSSQQRRGSYTSSLGSVGSNITMEDATTQRPYLSASGPVSSSSGSGRERERDPSPAAFGSGSAGPSRRQVGSSPMRQQQVQQVQGSGMDQSNSKGRFVSPSRKSNTGTTATSSDLMSAGSNSNSNANSNTNTGTHARSGTPTRGWRF